MYLQDGTRVRAIGDSYWITLAKPILVHRKRWIRAFTPEEEVRRTLLSTQVEGPIVEALTAAFRTIPMTVYPED